MKVSIKGTNAGIGTMDFEDDRNDCYTVTVNNGRMGERFQEIKIVISKEDIKRLAKAS